MSRINNKLSSAASLVSKVGKATRGVEFPSAPSDLVATVNKVADCAEEGNYIYVLEEPRKLQKKEISGRLEEHRMLNVPK